MNVEKIRDDFPILKSKIDGKPVVYMDNACMTLKPRQVIESINNYYYEFPGCAGRSMHKIAKTVTDEVDKARVTVQKFIGARKAEEIIFTRNTTEGINLVASSIGLKSTDVVVLSSKEHNSNLLPFQRLTKCGVKLEIVGSDQNGELDLKELKEKLNDNVKLVSMGHTRNLDGSTIDAKEVIKLAHKAGAKVLLDAAQSAPHRELNVKSLDVDFLAFSGHKMLGPTGTGVLYGKEKFLKDMSPYNVGGETVIDATYTEAKWEDLPHKFEAGLQHYAGIIGLAEACRYLKNIGMKNIEQHETKLNQIITEGLQEIEGLEIIGPDPPKRRSGIVSFCIEGIDPHQISLLLDNSSNIMIRSGAHCNHAWFNKHKLQGSARASCYFYNTESEAMKLVEELKKIVEMIR